MQDTAHETWSPRRVALEAAAFPVNTKQVLTVVVVLCAQGAATAPPIYQFVIATAYPPSGLP